MGNPRIAIYSSAAPPRDLAVAGHRGLTNNLAISKLPAAARLPRLAARHDGRDGAQPRDQSSRPRQCWDALEAASGQLWTELQPLVRAAGAAGWVMAIILA